MIDMATHSKSIIKASLERLDRKMAIGQSRREAKETLRTQQGKIWSVSTGMIHSFKTRSVYQEHTLKFVSWARRTYQIKQLEELDARANELAATWLREHIADGKSPYTLQVERSALRLFFDNRTLAHEVPLPRRSRANITRSRLAVAHDRHFQPANWQPLLQFLSATGLRRQEVQQVRYQDITQRHDGTISVHVASGKGGKTREVPVLPGHEAAVLAVIQGKEADAFVFPHLPKHLDVHSYRRGYAQALYLHHAPGRSLPKATGRLQPGDYDRHAILLVSQALGHNRLDVVLRHYLR
jgi:integrase